METKTLPAHVVYDLQGNAVSVVLLNGRTSEFYQLERMAFDDIGGFLKDITKNPDEKAKGGKSGSE